MNYQQNKPIRMTITTLGNGYQMNTDPQARYEGGPDTSVNVAPNFEALCAFLRQNLASPPLPQPQESVGGTAVRGDR
jgi:hypothetical protein